MTRLRPRERLASLATLTTFAVLLTMWAAGFAFDVSSEHVETYTSWLMLPAAAAALSGAAAAVTFSVRLRTNAARVAVSIAGTLAAIFLAGWLYLLAWVTLDNHAS
jgi:hypothetical protein